MIKWLTRICPWKRREETRPEDDTRYEAEEKNDSTGNVASNSDISPEQHGEGGSKAPVDRSWLVSCLKNQKILRKCDNQLIEKLANHGQVLSFPKATTVTEQGALGDGMFFILVGSVKVLVNGKPYAIRYAQECIGEMAMLDPTQKRSATLVAEEESYLLKISGKVLGELFEDANVLRLIAMELSNRLRERTKLVTSPNKKPCIFIGSSSSYLRVAKQLAGQIRKAGQYTVKVWDKNVFTLSRSNLESLLNISQHSDFGVFLLSNDDLVLSKGELEDAPRDNVVFELGLFMGQIGRNRTFIVLCGEETKVPSDLDGVVFFPLKKRGGKNRRIADCVTALKQEFDNNWVR